MLRPAALLTLLLLALVCPSAWAETPTERLRELFAEANRIITAPEADHDPTGALARVRVLVAGGFDFRGAAEQALGREWAARSRAERDEFVRLFADLLDRNLIARVAMTARLADGGFAIRFLDETRDGNTATVRAAVTARDGHELSFAYRMLRSVQGWKVRDVVMDGVSVVANYQAQVARVLQTGSFQELLTHMRSKASPGEVVLAGLADEERDEAIARVEPAALVARTPAVETAATPRPAVDAGPVRHAAAPEATPSKREPAPTRVTARPIATSVSYWVQLGAFRSAAGAIRLAAGVPDQDLTVQSGPGESLRVLVGPFDTRAAAAARAHELRARGYAPFVAETRD